MENWYSLIPPLVTIATAVFTKRIIPSLTLGLWVGSILLVPSLLGGTIKASEYIVDSLASKESAYIVLFLFVFGSLAEIFKVSGGIKGFANLADRYVKNERGALLSVWAASPATFLDCCFHVISTGTIANPLMEKVKGSKEKLAMVVNVTSSQLIVLIPIATTYVGYIIGVTSSAMQQAGLEGSPYSLYLKSIPFNFYSIGMVILSILVTFFGLGFGKWRFGKLGKAQGGVHGEHAAHEECEFEEKAPPRVTNLLLPLLVLVGLILFLFWYTGKGDGRTFLQAFMNAEFEKAIFIATFATVILTALYYTLQKIPMAELESHFLSGGTELLPPIVVLILSWSLSSATQDLGFVEFISKSVGAAIPTLFIPAAIFLIGGFTSYFIGSSWATWALIMPLGLPLAVSTGASIPLAVGAVLAGGSIGDNVSPLGETPVLTSAITDVPILEHVQTTLPYASIVIGLSTILFVAVQAALT
ncbi:MAG: Na+/H+ antiporter NhaC family protein [Firmicutes bacterium]|nr:Na+/H+ antiporter NhaC family protein [Bacillota bacterium]